MKATGIVRRIDDLGRVVIPKEIRRTMRIREGDPLLTSLTADERALRYITELGNRLESWEKRLVWWSWPTVAIATLNPIFEGAKSAFIAIPQAAQNSELIAQFSFANSKISIYQKYNLSLGVYEVIGDSHILSNS